MYFSFDTLENLTLTEGFEERAFDAQVQGRVECILFQDGDAKQKH